MFTENSPLFALTVKEFSELTRELVSQTIQSSGLPTKEPPKEDSGQPEHFNIAGLASFLNCSKVSVHSYKKMGLPFYRLGRKVLFKKTEVMDFMKGLKRKLTNH